eukprot:1561917-Prymnesium_polylepis.1
MCIRDREQRGFAFGRRPGCENYCPSSHAQVSKFPKDRLHQAIRRNMQPDGRNVAGWQRKNGDGKVPLVRARWGRRIERRRPS